MKKRNLGNKNVLLKTDNQKLWTELLMKIERKTAVNHL